MSTNFDKPTTFTPQPSLADAHAQHVEQGYPYGPAYAISEGIVPPPVKRRRKPAFIAVVILAIIGAVAGLVLGLSSGGTSKQELSLKYTVYDSGTSYSRDSCNLASGFSDLPGSPIKVTDAEGDVVAAGTFPDESDGYEDGDDCTFRMAFDDSINITGSKFYTISVGKRGDVTVTAQELLDDEGTFYLRLNYDNDN